MLTSQKINPRREVIDMEWFKLLLSGLLSLGIIGMLIGTYNLVFYYDEIFGLYFLIPVIIFVWLIVGIWGEDVHAKG